MSVKYQTLLGDSSVDADSIRATEIDADLADIGRLTVEEFTLTTGAGVDKILTSDAVGKATWQNRANVTLVGDASGLESATVVNTLANGTIPVNTLVVTSVFNAEVTRATNAENTLTTNLAAEVTRATNAENTLTTNLNTEITRATAAEGTLTTNLATEVTRATGAESTITTSVNTERTRAMAAEGVLTTNLASEITRASGAESTLTSNLASEVTRATNAENTLTSSVNTETTRAIAAEGTLTTNLAAEVARATAAESALGTAGVTLTGVQTLYNKSFGNSTGFTDIICSNTVYSSHLSTTDSLSFYIQPSGVYTFFASGTNIFQMYNSGNIAMNKPGSTAYLLNTNVFGTLDVSGISNFTNTTNSTSKTTGSVKMAGGLGVAGNVYCSQLFADGITAYSNAPPTEQGAKILWNRDGGSGRTTFANQQGGGTGGFEWVNYNGSNDITNLSATLSASGNLALATVKTDTTDFIQQTMIRKSASVGFGVGTEYQLNSTVYGQSYVGISDVNHGYFALEIRKSGGMFGTRDLYIDPAGAIFPNTVAAATLRSTKDINVPATVVNYSDIFKHSMNVIDSSITTMCTLYLIYEEGAKYQILCTGQPVTLSHSGVVMHCNTPYGINVDTGTSLVLNGSNAMHGIIHVSCAGGRYFMTY